MKHKLTWAGIILVITGVFIACNIYSLIPLYPLISSEFGISARQVSYGSASFTLTILTTRNITTNTAITKMVIG